MSFQVKCMNINSDINVLGGLHDLELIIFYHNQFVNNKNKDSNNSIYPKLKTDRSIKRFKSSILNTFLTFKEHGNRILVSSFLENEKISKDSLLILFWNASLNSELLNYLNCNIYFPAYYSGRSVIKKDEVIACLRELKQTEINLKEWSDSTIETTAYKYLTLLKKFNLMEGAVNKSIIHPYLTDRMLVIFIYWLLSVESKPNLLESPWLKYSLCDKQIFLERIMQKKINKYFLINYSGDKLRIELSIPYEKIYNTLNES